MLHIWTKPYKTHQNPCIRSFHHIKSLCFIKPQGFIMFPHSKSHDLTIEFKWYPVFFPFPRPAQPLRPLSTHGAFLLRMEWLYIARMNLGKLQIEANGSCKVRTNVKTYLHKFNPIQQTKWTFKHLLNIHHTR